MKPYDPKKRVLRQIENDARIAAREAIANHPEGKFLVECKRLEDEAATLREQFAKLRESYFDQVEEVRRLKDELAITIQQREHFKELADSLTDDYRFAVRLQVVREFMKHSEDLKAWRAWAWELAQ